MPSTHLSLHYHLVFSTKERQPLIDQEWRERLHAYLGGTVRDLGGVPECVGGISDHVHLLIGLKATHRLCDVLREIKVSSSKWIHETVALREFAWQDGYSNSKSKRSLRWLVEGSSTYVVYASVAFFLAALISSLI